jgi:predicted ATPase
MPLLATRSEGAPEVEQALARAHQLSERLGDPFRLPLTLLGQWGLRFARGELRTARELATQLMYLARSARPRAIVLGAHLALGLTATYEGDLEAAEQHLQQVLSVYDPERARPYRAMFDLAGLIEPRVTCAVYGAILSCMRGRLDRALAEIETGRRVANELTNAYALVTASAFAAMVYESRREPAAVAERAAEALAMARQHGFPQWAGLAMALRGWAVAAQGQHDAGLAELREGIETWRGTGTEIGRTYLLSLLADAHGRAGDVERALAVLDEAIAAMEQSGERLVEAELLRLRGEMLDSHQPDGADADRCLRDALAITRRRGARLLELRVATSIARRWIGRGQRAKARRLLNGIRGTFTEGAGTGDLEAARALLGEDGP